MGSLVVVRRETYMAGAIAHTVLAGLGAARWLQVVHQQAWADPMLGATVAAVVAAVTIGVVSLTVQERQDTVIGALWAVGMAVGILFISQTPGYNQDLMGYLFGDILLVRRLDLWMMAILDVVVVGAVVLLFPQLQAICFDEEFARLRGVAVRRNTLLLHVLTALTVVLLVRVVGIILVIALLTLPAAVAGHLRATLRGMMSLGVLLSVAFTTAGLAISYGPDLPAGATTIAVAGTVYLATVAGRAFLRRRRGG